MGLWSVNEMGCADFETECNEQRVGIFVGLELMFDCVFWHLFRGFFCHLFERETVEYDF
jgi:hypothetical protein